MISELGGAGLYNYSGGLQLMNSTVSGNQTAGFGAGLSVFQGGIELSNVTMAGNNANYDGNYFGSGGGISNSSGTNTLHSTVLARNLVAGVASNGAADCDGTLTSLGYNLIGDNAGCTMTPASGDQIGTNASPIDPRLAPLQTDNFPTFVYPLLPGSPAVDAGDSANCPATDQHLRPRPVGPRCDIGAYEALFWQIYLPAIAK